MISWHELPVVILMMTVSLCSLLSLCVVLWRVLPAAMLMMMTLAVSPSQPVHDLVA